MSSFTHHVRVLVDGYECLLRFNLTGGGVGAAACRQRFDNINEPECWADITTERNDLHYSFSLHYGMMEDTDSEKYIQLHIYICEDGRIMFDGTKGPRNDDTSCDWFNTKHLDIDDLGILEDMEPLCLELGEDEEDD